MQEKTYRVDIDAIFKTKNPGLYKWIPTFILTWIKKVAHQHEINEALEEAKDLTDGDFVDYIIQEKLQAHVRILGIENIPETGGAILVSNHPLGGLDGMVIMAEALRIRKDVKVIVNDILMHIPNFTNTFIPVNKLGKKAKDSLQKVEQAYAEGNLVIVFPAGLCSRKQEGEIKDLDWQKSFLLRSMRYSLPVIPCFFDGHNSKRFYRLAYWRKKLGIKVNIEMLYLSDEMFLQKGQTFTLTIGQAIPSEQLMVKGKKAEWQMAQKVKEYIYALGKNPKLTFDIFSHNSENKH
jgi:putative hemolysin